MCSLLLLVITVGGIFGLILGRNTQNQSKNTASFEATPSKVAPSPASGPGTVKVPGRPGTNSPAGTGVGAGEEVFFE